MRWQFWQSAPPQKLSSQVQRALTEKFQLEPQTVDSMLCLSKRGQYANRKVEFVRIFDPARIEGGDTTRVNYQDLRETNGHHKALLFEARIEKDDFGGRIGKNNQVHLTDLRNR